MMKILVVDDEPEIAKGLAFLIKRDCADFAAPLEPVFSSEQAFRCALAQKPDVILTDIRMPGMDGLELIRRLLAHGLSFRCIILSGYAEFSYAKTAMNLGISDFLTKPIDEEELEAALRRVCRETEKERTADAALNDVVLGHFLRSQRTVNIEQLKQRLSCGGFATDAPVYACLLWHTCEPLTMVEQRNVAALCCDLPHVCGAVSARCEGDSFAIVLALDKSVRSDRLIPLLKKLKSTKDNQGPVCISLGIYVQSFEELPYAYETSEIAMNYRVLQGQDSVISYTDLENVDTPTEWFSEKDLQTMEDCLDRLDVEGYEQAVHVIFSKVRKSKKMSISTLRQLSLNLVLFSIRKLSVSQLYMNEFIGKNIFTLNSIEKFDDVDQLENWIIHTVHTLNQLMLKPENMDKQDLIQEAKNYIRQNFNGKITLNDIAERFYINPYYFSQLFKKKTGMRYQEYVIQLRMERAKMLLKKTQLSLKDICFEVGYSDMSHFNHLFERTTGMRPGEYRKTHRIDPKDA